MLKKFVNSLDARPGLAVALAFSLIVSVASATVWFSNRHVDVIPAADVAVKTVPTFKVTREKLQDRLPNALDELAALTPLTDEPELPPLDIDIETLQPADISPALPVITPVPRTEARKAKRVARKQKPLLVRDCEALFGPTALVCKVD